MSSGFPKVRRCRCRGVSIDWNGVFEQYAAERLASGFLLRFLPEAGAPLSAAEPPSPRPQHVLVHMEEERDRRDPARGSVRAGLYREFLSSGLPRTVFSRVKAGKHGYSAARMMAMLRSEQETRGGSGVSGKVFPGCPPVESPEAEVVPDTVRSVSIPEGACRNMD